MKIIEDLEQGSPEWLQFRLSHITATDAGAIIGVNPYKDALDVFQEKMGLVISKPSNAAMARGTELEPKARELLNELLQCTFEPIVAVSDDVDFIMASLDGITKDGKHLCEIKCPGKKNHELAIFGEIAPYYFAQMQHQFYVTGAEKCFFCSYFPGHTHELVYIEIFPDREYIRQMVDAEKTFYLEHLCKFTPPNNWTLNMRKFPTVRT